MSPEAAESRMERSGRVFSKIKYKNKDCEHHFSFLLRSSLRVFMM